IGWQIDHIRRTHAVEIDLEADEKEIPLTAQQQVVVYRIAQGAINNALAHSQVSHIVIRIHSTERLFILEIVDNGTGISSQEDNAGTMGFGNMMQRAQLLGGRLAVQMAARKGTTVLLEVPAAPF